MGLQVEPFFEKRAQHRSHHHFSIGRPLGFAFDHEVVRTKPTGSSPDVVLVGRTVVEKRMGQVADSSICKKDDARGSNAINGDASRRNGKLLTPLSRYDEVFLPAWLDRRNFELLIVGSGCRLARRGLPGDDL